MLDSVRDAIEDICDQYGTRSDELSVDVHDGSLKNIVPSSGALNVVISLGDRSDLIKKGWGHRGVVGSNVYYLYGNKEVSSSKSEKVSKPKSESKKTKSRKK